MTDELLSWATSHRALKEGHGNVDDVQGFVAYLRARSGDLEKKLDEMALLALNWDSYGALPITPEAIASARLIVRAATAKSSTPEWVVPSVNGGITISWGEEAIIIDVHPDGIVATFWTDGMPE